METEAPAGTRDPLVVHSGNEARAVLIVLNPGQVMGDHQVKENAWVTVLEGRVRISAGSESVDAGPGMLFRFDPDERHSLASDERRPRAAAARALARRGPLPRQRGVALRDSTLAQGRLPTLPDRADAADQ